MNKRTTGLFLALISLFLAAGSAWAVKAGDIVTWQGRGDLGKSHNSVILRISSDGILQPGSDQVYDLGTSSNQWRYIWVASAAWANSGRLQNDAGFQYLASTAPLALSTGLASSIAGSTVGTTLNQSTMSISFSSRNYMTFEIRVDSYTLGTSPVMIQFNNDTSSADYAVVRTTGSLSQGAVGVFVSSSNALGILPSNFSASSATHVIHLSVYGNYANAYKTGQFTETITTGAGAVVYAYGTWVWTQPVSITSIQVVPFPGNANIGLGSSITVYGEGVTP